jgi:toxin ParE1/3/4
VRRLIYRTSAREDLRQLLRHITRETRNHKVGAAFVAKLRAQCEKLSQLDATLGTARPELLPDIRSTPYQNYVIYFRYVDDRIEIINILSASRDVDALFSNLPDNN